MDTLLKFIISLIIPILLSLTSAAEARCILPVPDGGEERPSPANIEGTIKSIKNNTVIINEYKSKRAAAVHIPEGQSIFTVFGGDDSASELRKGQRAKVWFVECKAPMKGIPESAYFQIFSKDPNDRP